MIAPRKLQSPGAAVHPVAAAVSSVRSTSKLVTKKGNRFAVPGTAGATALPWLDELEDALGVNIRDAPTKTTRANSDQACFLFIDNLQPDKLGANVSTRSKPIAHSAIAGERLDLVGIFRRD
ncbi:MAG: hypothetical protein DMF69_01080 [Acidobacteria bacterium]|nr:MAG: hypothetical protein DMF69_01080 [Acidobacteriota bacterium]